MTSRLWSAGKSGLWPGFPAGQAYADHALALDFKNSQYRAGAAYSADPATLPGYAMVRSGAKSRFNAAGSLLTNAAANVPLIVPGEGYWAEAAYTNLLLNAGGAANLNTQTTAALAAVPHTIAFYGTGTIAFSGSYAGANLVGTGAANQVSRTFTPAAAPLTVTVTGQVTYAVLAAGALVAPIIQTAGATAAVAADNLSASVNPVLADADFLWWAACNFGPASAGAEVVALMGGNSSWIGRNAGNLYIELNVGTYFVSSPPCIGQRGVVMMRRRGGKTALCHKIGGVVTLAAESGANALNAGAASFAVGQYGPGGGFAPNVAIEGVFIRLGTFSDAEITAILTAA